MADDPLSPLPPIVDPAGPPAPRGERHLVCEFCECRLTPHGHALELSAKAKKWRDHSDDVAKLTARIATLEELLREKERELAALKAPSAKKSVFD